MKRILLFLGALMLVIFSVSAQMSTDTTSLPYHEIPEYPESYAPGNIVGRMIDGLGYRYYWATHELRPEDLEYKPSESARSQRETLDHLYGLSQMILNAIQQSPNTGALQDPSLSFEELRAKTLKNFERTSQLLKQTPDRDLGEYPIVFQRPDRNSEIPFWHLLNGPIADALYHTGQVVSFRRSSGNPMHPGVSVFMGKTKE